MPVNDPEQIADIVRARYAAAATRVAASDCCDTAATRYAQQLYEDGDRDALPDDAVAASLGCANPVALADLHPGETVLDLGSGGGVDVLLSARRVGPDGLVYGLDMTDEMIELAERNRIEAGAENVRFLKGRMEQIPLPDDSVDVVISNCVINLAADKDRVLAEAHRVLRPSGRFAIADIATLGPIPEAIRGSLDAWTACIAGALDVDGYTAKLSTAGFSEPQIQVIRTYGRDDLALVASSTLGPAGIDQFTPAELDAAEDKIASIFVRAIKTT
jgi:SAM-dependent methyltransferase